MTIQYVERVDLQTFKTTSVTKPFGGDCVLPIFLNRKLQTSSRFNHLFKMWQLRKIKEQTRGLIREIRGSRDALSRCFIGGSNGHK